LPYAGLVWPARCHHVAGHLARLNTPLVNNVTDRLVRQAVRVGFATIAVSIPIPIAVSRISRICQTSVRLATVSWPTVKRHISVSIAVAISRPAVTVRRTRVGFVHASVRRRAVPVAVAVSVPIAHAFIHAATRFADLIGGAVGAIIAGQIVAKELWATRRERNET